MPSCKKKATAAKLSPWRAALLRCSAYYLDVVCAPDEKAALGAVIADFKISEKRRRCLGTRSSGALNLASGTLAPDRCQENLNEICTDIQALLQARRPPS